MQQLALSFATAHPAPALRWRLAMVWLLLLLLRLRRRRELLERLEQSRKVLAVHLVLLANACAAIPDVYRPALGCKQLRERRVVGISRRRGCGAEGHRGRVEASTESAVPGRRLKSCNRQHDRA